MPRRTAEQLQARRQEILHAAWRCFARQGFHATSMDQVIAEAGLSAGAVYRYFTGKDELIAAAAAEATQVGLDVFDQIDAESPPPSPSQVVAWVLTNVVGNSDRDGCDVNRLIVQVWGEAIRSPPVLAMAQDAQRQLRAGFVMLAQRWVTHGQLPNDTDPTAIGAVMFAIIPGFILQHLILDDVQPQALADGLTALTGWRPTPAVDPPPTDVAFS